MWTLCANLPARIGVSQVAEPDIPDTHTRCCCQTANTDSTDTTTSTGRLAPRPSVQVMRQTSPVANGSLMTRMASPAALWAAWARVCAGSGVPGADGVSVAEFAQRLGPRLEALSRLLATGRYRAQPLRLVTAQRAGRPRERGIPTVCDRIAQRAFLAAAGRQLDSARADVSNRSRWPARMAGW